ncbi:MAG: hypothetical protein IJL02_12150, partial [Methanobrevibacter sp.]|uniref:hypothetical protein n=1 Tax=Methanobrevibacter sp. TaxID=66852 RepID=UPI0025EEA5C6
VKDKNITYIKWDMGVPSNHNDIWRLGIGYNATFERLANYTKITDTNNTTSGVIYTIKQDNSNNYQLPTSCMIELDIKRVDGSATSPILTPRPNGVSISSYSANLDNFGITDTNWHTVQLKLTPTKISRMINGVEITGQNVIDTVNYWCFGLWTGADITEIHFKNFVVYEI